MNSHPTAHSLSSSPASVDAAQRTSKSLRLYFLNLSSDAQEAARKAAETAFPNEPVHTVSDPAGIDAANCERCLVVLDRAEAVSNLVAEAGGAPRCAVVVMGHDVSDLAETVPPEEWNPALLARVFRSALLEQELLRENARLRGDLKTVARRISHDLRTPLGCIYTTSGVFKELPPGDQESVLSMAGVIKESAGEISSIVDRVSFVLKASADPIAPTRVDMGGVVATVLSQLEKDLQKADARVTIPTAWPEVAGVSTWLVVVWSNLIRNAFQHGGPSAKIHLKWDSENDFIRFSVIDQGSGLTDFRLAGLFSPFDKLHGLHVAGLGLSFVQRLIALQGGECRYEKNAGGGACFSFTLPAIR